MGLALARSVATLGLEGHIVDVEVDVSNGLPYFAIVGLPDAALDEAKNRVRSALSNSGLGFPMSRIVANLSPATLRKSGSSFDLALAIGLLVAEGSLTQAAVQDAVFLGELGLDGRLRPTPGILPATLGARRAGIGRVFVPTANGPEASLVSGVETVPVSSIAHAASLCGADGIDPDPVTPILLPETDGPAVEAAELADVVGQPEAVRALVIAAAGRHHLLAVGPPGAGKSLLAARLPGILPDLTDAEALDVTALRSLVSGGRIRGLQRRPPVESPHHSATIPAIVGGGSGVIRPGAASLASHGVLFLDEAAEFPRAVLDSLRQCLETGEIVIHRASGSARFPGRFQLVLASNPCPCGMAGSDGDECACPPMARRRYLARLSGPLLDRVDLRIRVARAAPTILLSGSSTGVTSAAARAAVATARAATARRLTGTPWKVNAEVPGAQLRGPLRVPPHARASLDRALERGAISLRGYDRVLRVAWSIADLAGEGSPGRDAIGEALFLRQAVAGS